MKKLLSILLALTMLCAISVTAFAAEIDENSDPKTAGTSVTATVAPTYTVVIPETCAVSEGATSTPLSFSVSGNPQPGATIEVGFSYDKLLKNTKNAAYTIPYVITEGNNQIDALIFAEDHIRNGSQINLSVDITADAWAAAYAGSYSGLVTFSVTYRT